MDIDCPKSGSSAYLELESYFDFFFLTAFSKRVSLINFQNAYKRTRVELIEKRGKQIVKFPTDCCFI